MPILAHHGRIPQVHPSAFIADGAQLIGEVLVGEDASIWFNAVLRGDINSIQVGARTNVQDGCVIHVTRELPVRLGDDVTVGHMAMLHGCAIGDRSLIGMNAVVLDRANVGSSSIVAAGALVREGSVVPDGVLVAGVPARVIRPLTEEERESVRLTARNYVEYARSYLHNDGGGSL